MAQVRKTQTPTPRCRVNSNTDEIRQFLDQLNPENFPDVLQLMQILSTIAYEYTNDFGPCIDCMSLNR